MRMVILVLARIILVLIIYVGVRKVLGQKNEYQNLGSLILRIISCYDYLIHDKFI